MASSRRIATAGLVALVVAAAAAACSRHRVNGQPCMRNSDCASEICLASLCQAPPVYGTTTSYPTISSGGSAGQGGTGGQTGGTGGTPTGGAGGVGGGGGAPGGGGTGG
ncbi:MAG: hypothetical protein IT373_37695 [Polyangiaceae bacterium]|nr:hypothetical protein [Polyangiaceae bacterium]